MLAVNERQLTQMLRNFSISFPYHGPKAAIDSPLVRYLGEIEWHLTTVSQFISRISPADEEHLQSLLIDLEGLFHDATATYIKTPNLSKAISVRFQGPILRVLYSIRQT